MNYFVAEYKDGITYGHCKGLDSPIILQRICCNLINH